MSAHHNSQGIQVTLLKYHLQHTCQSFSHETQSKWKTLDQSSCRSNVCHMMHPWTGYWLARFCTCDMHTSWSVVHLQQQRAARWVGLCVSGTVPLTTVVVIQHNFSTGWFLCINTCFPTHSVQRGPSYSSCLPYTWKKVAGMPWWVVWHLLQACARPEENKEAHSYWWGTGLRKHHWSVPASSSSPQMLEPCAKRCKKMASKPRSSSTGCVCISHWHEGTLPSTNRKRVFRKLGWDGSKMECSFFWLLQE